MGRQKGFCNFAKLRYNSFNDIVSWKLTVNRIKVKSPFSLFNSQMCEIFNNIYIYTHSCVRTCPTFLRSSHDLCDVMKMGVIQFPCTYLPFLVGNIHARFFTTFWHDIYIILFQIYFSRKNKHLRILYLELDYIRILYNKFSHVSKKYPFRFDTQ